MNKEYDRIQHLVSQVAGLKLAAYGGGDASFNLRACHCAAPTWQQPCPVCSYYPMYGEPGTNWPVNSCTLAIYEGHIARHENLIAWVFHQNRRTVAYKEGTQYKLATDWAYESAKFMPNVPTAREIWTHFHGRETPLATASAAVWTSYRGTT
jgi:hypothetical protein